MPTDYLFLWQPVPEWPEAYIDGLVARFDMMGSIIEDWRCGWDKAIQPTAPTDVDEIPEYRLDRRIERNRAAARLAKDVHGLRCQACRLDFMELYGELGRDFIEVHHRRPLAGLT
jgi:hypothetical protein